MHCATKVYNGLLWHLREEFKQTGKTRATRKHLNAILKTLPRAKAYYSLSVQATRDEVIQAYTSFFALRAAGRTQHQMPGFRHKTDYSPLRYYDRFGFVLDGNRLILSLGTRRQDGVRSVAVTLQMRPGLPFKRVRNVLLTYDNDTGLCAHLVVEVGAKQPSGSRKVAVDLGETQAITAIFDDGTALMHSGRLINMIKYKAGLYGMKVIEVSEAYTSQTCHSCGEVRKSNRSHRGLYRCGCGWRTHADANAVANIFLKTFQVSPLTRSSGAVAAPVVVPIRLGWHTVHETKSPVAMAA